MKPGTAIKTVRRSTPVIGICGWKKSGKTTLTVALVAEFTRRGLKVATLKHAHQSFTIDDDETDSARHRKAGAGEVAVVSANRWAMIGENDGAEEPDFADVIGWFSPCDLIIVEGYKSAPIPKIEARRTASLTSTPLADTDARVIAIAADHQIESVDAVPASAKSGPAKPSPGSSPAKPDLATSAPVKPVFDLNDIGGIADFIAASIGPLTTSGAGNVENVNKQVGQDAQ